MKIAILGSRGYPSNYGGYESFIRELSLRLVDMGVEITVYCHSSLFKDKPKKLNGINLVYLPAIESKSLSQLTHSFLSIIHASLSNADIIFVVNSANGPFGIIPKMLGKKTVINVDGLEWLRPKWKGFPAKYYRFAARLATRFFDVLVSDAEEMRKVYLEEFGSESEVIAYGAPKPLEDNGGDKIAKWNLKPGEYFLIVGRLIPDNNALLIAEGYIKSTTNKKLVIVGGVPYEDQYVNKIVNLSEIDKRIVVTGHIDDREAIAQLFHNSYMYIHGHEYGGTNPTMIEALGYGCAILALNTRFNQEMLQNGKYGVYFDKNLKSVKEAIDHWHEADKKISELKSIAHEGVIQKYQWDYVTKKYLDLFTSTFQNK